MKSLTTDQRLRHAIAALRQAATLLRDGEATEGGMTATVVATVATLPPAVARRCLLLGSEPGDTVLDPFAGVGTTGMVALAEGRRFVGVELNERHAQAAEARVRGMTLGLGVASANRPPPSASSQHTSPGEVDDVA